MNTPESAQLHLEILLVNIAKEATSQGQDRETDTTDTIITITTEAEHQDLTAAIVQTGEDATDHIEDTVNKQ